MRQPRPSLCALCARAAFGAMSRAGGALAIAAPILLLDPEVKPFSPFARAQSSPAAGRPLSRALASANRLGERTARAVPVHSPSSDGRSFERPDGASPDQAPDGAGFFPLPIARPWTGVLTNAL